MEVNYICTFCLSCQWERNNCSYLNFTANLTDYGLCYTFNGEEPYKVTSQIGTWRHIEIYELICIYNFMYNCIFVRCGYVCVCVCVRACLCACLCALAYKTNVRSVSPCIQVNLEAHFIGKNSNAFR